MSRAARAAALVVAATVATPAAAMDVATFLAKANALKAKGPMALFSSDLKLLKREGEAVGAQLRADRKARAAVGKPPLYCPPEGAARMGSTEVVDGLAAIPPAERGMSLKDGFVRVLQRKYPCR